MNDIASITVLNWNRLEYTKQTVEGIVSKTTTPYVLVLVDNNSREDSGVRKYLSSVTADNTGALDVMHVFNDDNLGVAGGRNIGIFTAEQKYQPKYTITIDDDVLVPADWDLLLRNACDKIPKLGVTGVNVESKDYNIEEINGVRVKPKRRENLGGACLCMPRRAFLRLGYYRSFGLYSGEDSDLFIRASYLGLISAYIEPKGVHLDEDKNKVYRKAKTKLHQRDALPVRETIEARLEYRKAKGIYVPYVPYDPEKNKKKYDVFDNSMFGENK